MTNFEEYVEKMEKNRIDRKREEINVFLQRNLRECTFEQTKRGLLDCLGLLEGEKVI